MEESFSDIAALAEPTPTDPTPTPPAPAKVEKPAAPPPKAPEKKPEPTPPKKDEIPQKTPELRAAYERVRDEAETLRRELTQAKAEGASKKELEAIKKDFDATKKERDDLASELRYANYEKSPEYKDTYVKPLHKAFQEAYESMTELEVDQDGATRKATEEDFNSILNLPLGQAVKQAKSLFGDAATVVLQHRQKVLDAEHARKDAITNWKTKAEERDRTVSEQQQQILSSTRTRFSTYQETMAKKYPDLYSPSAPDAEGKPTDPEGDALLEKGDALVKKAWGLSEEKLTHEQLVDVQAELSLRARSFGRLKLQNNRLTAKIKELEEQLAAYAKSEPGTGDADTTTEPAPSNWADQSDAEIAGLANATR